MPGLGSEIEICVQFGSAIKGVGTQAAYGAELVGEPPASLSDRCDPAWAKGSQLGCPLIFPVPLRSLPHSVACQEGEKSPLTCRRVQTSLYFFQMYGRLFTST